MRSETWLALGTALLLTAACSDSAGDGETAASIDDGVGTTDGDDDTTTEGSTDGSTDSTTSDTTTSDTTTADTEDTTDDDPDEGGIKFDMAVLPDFGGDTGEEGPIIPENCDQAAAGETTVGCLFYAVDLDQNGGLENDQYAIGSSIIPNTDVGTAR